MEKHCIKGATQINQSRDAEIVAKHDNGASQKELALEYEISRSRISAIIKKAKLDSVPGGKARRIEADLAKRRARRKVLREQKSLKVYGVDCAYIKTLRATHENYHKSALGRYITFKKGCALRDIPNKLSIKDWWELWSESGHYLEYGKYAMGRINYDIMLDIGYTKTNSVIRTNAENVAYYQNFRNGNIASEVYLDSFTSG